MSDLNDPLRLEHVVCLEDLGFGLEVDGPHVEQLDDPRLHGYGGVAAHVLGGHCRGKGRTREWGRVRIG